MAPAVGCYCVIDMRIKIRKMAKQKKKKIEKLLVGQQQQQQQKDNNTTANDLINFYNFHYYC